MAVQKTQRDFTQGPILPSLLSMALPTAFGFLAQTAYDLANLYWIGKLSAKAVAGTTIFATMMWIVEILNEIIGMSSVSLISQAYGSGDMERTRRAVEQTIVFKALVALVAGLCLFAFLRPMASFFSADAEVVGFAWDYGWIRAFFLPVFFSSFTVNTALRNIGDAKRPMIILSVSSVANVLLDPFLIFTSFTVPFTHITLPGLGLGVFGAAIATVTAVSGAFLFGLYYLSSGRARVRISLRGLLRLDRELDRKLITIGLPAGAELLTRNIASVVVLKLVAGYGTAAVAALGIGQRLTGFAFMPLMGLTMGGAAMVGQNLGAEKTDRAAATSRLAAVCGVACMLIFAACGWLFAEGIVGAFVEDPEVIGPGALMLRIVLTSLCFTGATFGIATVFNGSGYNVPFLVAAIIGKYAVQIPLLVLFGPVLKLPVAWMWITFIASEATELAVMSGFYIRGRWKTMRVGARKAEVLKKPEIAAQ